MTNLAQCPGRRSRFCCSARSACAKTCKVAQGYRHDEPCHRQGISYPRDTPTTGRSRRISPQARRGIMKTIGAALLSIVLLPWRWRLHHPRGARAPPRPRRAASVAMAIAQNSVEKPHRVVRRTAGSTGCVWLAANVAMAGARRSAAKRPQHAPRIAAWSRRVCGCRPLTDTEGGTVPFRLPRFVRS